MKIGVFISGQIRGSNETLRQNIELLSTAFTNSEMVYGVWNYDVESNREIIDSLTGEVEVFEDFDLHYSPYLDNPGAVDHYQYRKKFQNPNPARHLHQTKQMLFHNYLVKKHGSQYDVIVRARWDTTISPIIDFTPYAREVYNTPCTMNISARHDYESDILLIYEKVGSHQRYMKHRDKTTGKVHKRIANSMFLDNGIILHRYEDWNVDLVEQLHKDCKLLAAEFGWWQILVEGTNHHQWVHYDGGANTNRTITRRAQKHIRNFL